MMFKHLLLAALTVLTIGFIAPPSHAAAPEIGKPAPAFTGTDSTGKKQSLEDYKGKIVVLEWTNPECPFVKKHYESGNMQKLQKEHTADDVVWLSINSSAEGKQGHLTAEQATKLMADQKSMPTALILDSDGTIGTLYAAKTTPHMFVIAKDGTLAYEGAIDDNDSSDKADAATAKNYVTAAITALKSGKSPETAQTKPYGCSVKY